MSRVHDRRSRDTIAAGNYAPIEVDDPMALEAGEKITVLRQTRGDPLGRLHAHHQMDEAQYHAGRAYQNDWEIAERGARAIDPGKEAVDGGMAPEPITDRQAKARKRLIRIKGELGRRLADVLEAFLIDKRNMQEISGSRDQVILRRHSALLRVALDELAEIYGFSTKESVKKIAVRQII